MARTPREHRLETRDARAKLKPSGEPYWRQIVPGTFLGYRKKRSGGSTWVVRQRSGAGYSEQWLAVPDDTAPADGQVVLTYAQAIAAAQAVQVDANAPAPRYYGDGKTLNTVIDDYFREHLAGKGSESIARAQVARHVAEGIGRRLVTALDARALRTWLREMANKPPTNRGKLLDFDPSDPDQVRARKSTANRVLTIVKAALNFAWREEALPATLPAYWMRVEAFDLGDEPPPRMLESAEISRLLQAAPEDLRDLLTGALMTGCRYGEIVALRCRHYDRDNATVRVFQSKTGKTLNQPLTTEGVALFNRLTAGRAPESHLFTRTGGQPWGRSDAAKPMRAAVAKAGLEDVTFKTTRATYGKLLLLATGNIEMVAKALGHSDSRITRKHYAQYLPSELAQAIAKMPALDVSGSGLKKPRAAGKKRRTE